MSHTVSNVFSLPDYDPAPDPAASLDRVKEELRVGGDGGGAVGKHAAQSLRQRNHPLPRCHGRNDVIREVGGGLCHVPAITKEKGVGSLFRPHGSRSNAKGS